MIPIKITCGQFNSGILHLHECPLAGEKIILEKHPPFRDGTYRVDYRTFFAGRIGSRITLELTPISFAE